MYLQLKKGKYAYICDCYRLKGKVIKFEKYYGRFVKPLSLKDIHYFLTGKPNFVWAKTSPYRGFQPLIHFYGLNVEKAVKKLIDSVGVSKASLIYIMINGVPKPYLPVFRKYGLLGKLNEKVEDLKKKLSFFRII